MRRQLKGTLNSTQRSLDLWANDKKLDAQILSSQPAIRSHIIGLLELAKSKKPDKQELQSSENLQWLRKHLGAACKKYGFVSFVLFEPGGMEVGALLDAPIGKKDLSQKSDFFFRSLQGETRLSHPFPGEIDLPDIHGKFRKSWPTMFVSTPIFGEKDEVLAVLAFRLRPEAGFSQIFAQGRFGETGETYAFNDKGVLISKSRFETFLKENAFLGNERSSILNIHIRTPGDDSLDPTNKPKSAPSSWPLTLMAASAIDQNTDENIEGYSDYRGLSVVGAWTWLEDYNFGITVEVDANEAFRPINDSMKWFFGFSGLLLMTGVIGLTSTSRYAANRKRARENESRLNSIMSSLADSVITIDQSGIIQTANPSVKDQFFYHDYELIGKNIKILMPEPYQSEHDQYIKDYLKTGKAKIINLVRNLEGLRKDGSTFPLELRVTEVAFGGKPYFSGIIRDVTRQKQSEKLLREANLFLEKRIEHRTEELRKTTEKAERNNMAKSEFLSRMSHELRTPMNAILGFSQLLRTSDREPLTQDQKTRIDEISKAGNHLLDLINEVLDLSSIESGKTSISSEPVCVVDLVEEILLLVQPVAEQHNIELIDNVTQKEPVFVLADKIRLKQVLLNLISNGVKYNRPGGSVGLSIEHQPDNLLRINVQDTGMGIAKEKQAKIFDPFDRLGAEGSGIEGTGIGMTISKKLTELMQGHIGVESEVGKGSCFYITLPVCKKAEKLNIQTALLESENANIARDNTLPFSILYIEDNPANLRLVESILRDYTQVNFISAPEAKLGLELARAHCPDLILMDINLPEMDGFTALKHLQNYNETYQTPVVALSANAMEKDLERGLAAGFNDYLTKPIKIDDLLHILGKYIKERAFREENPS